MKRSILKSKMEVGDRFKNEASPKSHTSRGNLLQIIGATKKIVLFCTILCLPCLNIQGQSLETKILDLNRKREVASIEKNYQQHLDLTIELINLVRDTPRDKDMRFDLYCRAAESLIAMKEYLKACTMYDYACICACDKPSEVTHAKYVFDIVEWVGGHYMYNGKYDEALKTYEIYFKVWNQLHSYNNLERNQREVTIAGKTYMSEKFSSLPTINERIVKIWGEAMSKAYLAKGDTTSAIKHLEDVAPVADETCSNSLSDCHITRITLADLLWTQGKFDEAAKSYERILRKTRRFDTLSVYTRRLCGYYLNVGNYEDAFHCYKYYFGYDKQGNNRKTAEDYSNCAFCAYKLNYMEEAGELYDQAIKLNPSVAINAEARKEAQQHIAEKQRQEREREERRLAAIRNAEIGEKLLYSENWKWEEGAWIFKESGSFTMMVTCFVERKEGPRYQLRIGDIQSSSSQRSATPTINGVEVHNMGKTLGRRQMGVWRIISAFPIAMVCRFTNFVSSEREICNELQKLL
jgi:tetratricopeptide (TPR) repeat protein